MMRHCYFCIVVDCFFVLGMITGAILLLFVAMVISRGSSNNDGLVLLDKPGDYVSTNPFKVFPVLDSGDALATEGNGSLYLGITVLFYSSGNQSFYDDQIIEVASDECVRQVGTFKYITRKDSEKTVPVVRIFKRK